RQPYTVYGLLRTADSVSPVSAEQVGLSLLVFVIVYAIVFTAGIFYMWRIAAQGPVSDTKPPPPRPSAKKLERDPYKALEELRDDAYEKAEEAAKHGNS
ncbi:MAG: cytochrome ubiquinol oxidase subunit I, partial [Hyphomicrobiales bacterium]